MTVLVYDNGTKKTRKFVPISSTATLIIIKNWFLCLSIINIVSFYNMAWNSEFLTRTSNIFKQCKKKYSTI